jgi:hypothetical protein
VWILYEEEKDLFFWAAGTPHAPKLFSELPPIVAFTQLDRCSRKRH